MTTYIRYSIYWLWGIMLLVACQQQEPSVEDYGYLHVNVQTNTTVLLKSGDAEQDLPTIGLRILNNKGEVLKETDDWTSLEGQSLPLAPGQYTLQAFSVGVDGEAVAFDQPLYTGYKDITIQPGSHLHQTIECTLATAMVTVTYSPKVINNFKSLVTQVSNRYGSLNFTKADQDKAGYFGVDTLRWQLAVVNYDNKSFTTGITLVTDVQPRTHYRIVIDVKDPDQGGTGITIEVDETLREYKYTILLPLGKEAEELPVSFTLDTPNPWGKFAHIAGTLQSENLSPSVAIEMRKQGEGDEAWGVWSQPASVSGTQFTCRFAGLDFGTTYQYRAVSGNSTSAVGEFTTESFVQIPNLAFDNWAQNGKTWYPSTAKANDYWGTGNEGVTSTLAGGKPSNTAPSDDAVSGKSARLETLGGITLVGVAAGNLFVGTYKTDALNPSNSVKMGRAYNGARPTKLKGWYKYLSKPIDYQGTPAGLQNDLCHIYIWLKDAQGNQIGYGEFFDDRVMSAFEPFEINVQYTDLLAKPATIAIVATSSRYGGVFSGSKVVGAVGKGSVLWVDEFVLEYE